MNRPLPSRRHVIQAGALSLSGWAAAVMGQPAPQATAGRLERWPHLPSRHVDARHVDVWLPDGYEQRVQAGKRFAVLYMHDGQMLFDPSSTWNHQAWGIDVAAQALQSSGAVGDFIIVAPWNNGALRHSEYFPAAFMPHLPPDVRDAFAKQLLQGRPRSDEYLRFLVEELKPAVDARYATRPEREACFVMGSSMGGLISAYALWEHRQVFGGAACLSTHWIGTFERNSDFPRAAQTYLKASPPPPQSVKLWTDRGTVELDALYVDAHAQVTGLLNGLGFKRPRFQSSVIAGSGHNETAWGQRVQDPLKFLLGPLPAGPAAFTS